MSFACETEVGVQNELALRFTIVSKPTPTLEYVKSISSLIGASHILAVFEENDTLKVFFDDKKLIDTLIRTGIHVLGHHVKVDYVIPPGTKVVLSNIDPVVSNFDLTRLLSMYGSIVSPIICPPVSDEMEYCHISYGVRYCYMKINEPIPNKLEFKYGDQLCVVKIKVANEFVSVPFIKSDEFDVIETDHTPETFIDVDTEYISPSPVVVSVESTAGMESTDSVENSASVGSTTVGESTVSMESTTLRECTVSVESTTLRECTVSVESTTIGESTVSVGNAAIVESTASMESTASVENSEAGMKSTASVENSEASTKSTANVENSESSMKSTASVENSEASMENSEASVESASSESSTDVHLGVAKLPITRDYEQNQSQQTFKMKRSRATSTARAAKRIKFNKVKIKWMGRKNHDAFRKGKRGRKPKWLLKQSSPPPRLPSLSPTSSDVDDTLPPPLSINAKKSIFKEEKLKEFIDECKHNRTPVELAKKYLGNGCDDDAMRSLIDQIENYAKNCTFPNLKNRLGRLCKVLTESLDASKS